MKRKNRGENSQKISKTDTIKQRAIYVYLPSIQTAKRWKEIAEKEKVSVSKFVVEHVENSLQQEKNHTPRTQLLENLNRYKEENNDLRRQNKILNKALDNLDSELKSFRLKPFLEPSFEGVRQYEKELITVFRRQKVLRSDEVLDVLNISISDQDSIRAINKQLENLQNYGLIKIVRGGWKWSG